MRISSSRKCLSLRIYIFNEDEAERICSLAVSHNRQTNQLTWIGTTNGDFSVKSAYHMERVYSRRLHEEAQMSLYIAVCVRVYGK